MAYVATRGGEAAIQQAEHLFHHLRGNLSAEYIRSLQETMPYLIDRVMGEASLYAPELAALALAQTGGELSEAVLLLRAYRSTQPRLAYAQPLATEDLLTLRRISAAFKDIPGGQILGPTLDYSHRLLNLDLLDHPLEIKPPISPADQPAPQNYPALADWQRQEDWLPPLTAEAVENAQSVPDVTRDPLVFPAPRAHRLQSLARAETGGILALGYAGMRGYGIVHPTVNEVRLGYGDVLLKHPLTGATFSAGRVRISQAEIVDTGGGTPEKSGLDLGFSATFGWNEVKVIAASMLDLAMDRPNTHPAHTEEFVLYHTEAVESSGFCIHYKLPHYVTFSSSMDNLRQARESRARGMHEGMFVQSLVKKQGAQEDETKAVANPSATPTTQEAQP
jgi:alpha-D-ribose 1-methylphosphonate 5-triphosphate synthase subunit PhnI